MDSTSLPQLRPGSTGSYVMLAQVRLKDSGFNPGPANGIYTVLTQAAVRSFKASHGLAADKIVDAATWQRLLPSGFQLPVTGMGDSGPYVKAAQIRLRDQRFLPGQIDGSFGESTETAVRACQDHYGLPADGVLNEATWGALLAADDASGQPCPPTCPAGTFAHTVEAGDT